MTFDGTQKAQLVRSNLEKLAQIPQSTYEEFASDFRNTEAALHLLQTTIQALIDFGSKLCAQLGLDTPRTSFEVLERLEHDGRLPGGSATRFAPIVGFRNRVVHLYDRIDPQIVHRVVKERRRDLIDLLGLLLAIEA
ncbi:MAG: HepT-like ribonuclease domain-containing protein [Planctomycetota bacterium]